MRVLSVASEAFPLVKTGGLADVAGALPEALAEHNIEMVTLLPAYPKVKAALKDHKVSTVQADVLGFPVAFLYADIEGLGALIALECPQLFERDGGIYGDKTGRDWPDNGLRYAVLCRAAQLLAQGLDGAKGFDVVHAHDWQAGLVPAYLRYYAPHIPSVLTIHNIAFQGQFSPSLFGALGLPNEAMAVEGLEYYGDISFLKAGVHYATAVTTVSPTYAREILTPHFGMGFDGLIRARSNDLHGIVNGLDVRVWDPETDPHLDANYSVSDITKRSANRRALANHFGLDHDAEAPLAAIVSRLTAQKGMDVVLEAVDRMVAMGFQLVVLGSGDAEFEHGFRQAALRHAGRVGVQIGYDEGLSHLIHGGADTLLVPSRFEPCGLTQLSALRYGVIPVVARTGGLADTIVDANHAALTANVATGVQFDGVHAQGFLDAMARLHALFQDKTNWILMQRRAMRAELGWTASAGHYAALYKELRSS